MNKQLLKQCTIGGRYWNPLDAQSAKTKILIKGASLANVIRIWNIK